MIRVMPGVLRPASRMADLTCAEATGRRYSIGMAGQMPLTVSGRQALWSEVSRARMSAPICDSGSITRPIGRLVRLASPMNVALMAWDAIRPISKRVDVPLLPMLSALSGCIKPPTPTPWTVQTSSFFSIPAPIARRASAVARTSSPSSRPVIRLLPTARAENINARCEIDLSPGTKIFPVSEPDGLNIAGCGELLVMSELC